MYIPTCMIIDATVHFDMFIYLGGVYISKVSKMAYNKHYIYALKSRLEDAGIEYCGKCRGQWSNTITWTDNGKMHLVNIGRKYASVYESELGAFKYKLITKYLIP